MPVITTAILTTLATTLGEKGLESAFENLGEKVSDSAINWFKTLFYKNGKPKKVLQELQEEPSKEINQQVVKSIIENSIEDDPKHLKYLQEIINIIPKNQNYVNNYKNINTGKIDTKGGDLHIGDNYEN
jgi:hypothetical protein